MAALITMFNKLRVKVQPSFLVNGTASDLALLRVTGSQLWSPWPNAKVSRANSDSYSNKRVWTQRVKLAGHRDY